MLTQRMWKWHEQKIQCYRELALQGCSHFLWWWRDHRLEFPALSELARNTFSVVVTCAASDRGFSMTEHVNSRRASLKSSSADGMVFSNSAPGAQKEALTVDWKFSVLVFFKSFCWLWNEPFYKLPPASKHVAWLFSGFQTPVSRVTRGLSQGGQT